MPAAQTTYIQLYQPEVMHIVDNLGTTMQIKTWRPDKHQDSIKIDLLLFSIFCINISRSSTSPPYPHRSPPSVVRLGSEHAHTPIVIKPNRRRKNWKNKIERIYIYIKLQHWVQQITQFLIQLPLKGRQWRLHNSNLR